MSGEKIVRRVVYPALLLAVNAAIIAKLFLVEYSAYLESNEGSFIAIARQVAEHPGDLMWWPFWECGLPFQNTYLPLLNLLVGGFSWLTGHSAGLSFHQVCAAFFCLGPVFLYAMGLGMTRQAGASFLAALAYSVLSPCVLLVPAIRADLGKLWDLRRLQILAYYGEGPHSAAIAVIPLAILALYLVLNRPGENTVPALTGRGYHGIAGRWLVIGAGVAMGTAVLLNAFAAVILGMVAVSMAAVADRFWKALGYVAFIGVLAYAWISPLLPPSVIQAIRMNSPTVDGDYRFTARSAVGVAILALGFLVLWLVSRKWNSSVMRFFLLFSFLASGVVILGAQFKVYVVPQPHRYQIAMDLGLSMFGVLGGAELLRRFRPQLLRPAGAIVFVLLVFALRHNLNYAHRLIKSTDMTQTDSYRVARWVDEHMAGQRVLMPSSYSYQFNDFSDTPQVLGGHDPMLPNFVMRIAGFVMYSGMNAGERDGEISVLWLEALGAHAVVVPGPTSQEVYKPFVNPRKFEGLLPVVGKIGGDTIYEVPSGSLAHVVGREAIVQHQPIHGLDVGEIERYVGAIGGVGEPLVWRNRHTAVIDARLEAGQVVSVQTTYHAGWRAAVNGAEAVVRGDGLGLVVIESECRGRCEVVLTFDGGTEWRVTLGASLLAMVGAVGMAVRGRRSVEV